MSSLADLREAIKESVRWSLLSLPAEHAGSAARIRGAVLSALEKFAPPDAVMVEVIREDEDVLAAREVMEEPSDSVTIRATVRPHVGLAMIRCDIVLSEP